MASSVKAVQTFGKKKVFNAVIP
jgi:small subunit ribosomal protein S16e